MPKEGVFHFGATPVFLTNLGANQLPIVMPEDNILKFTSNYKNHAVALDNVVKIPKELADPLMVFKGSAPNSYAIISALMDKTNNPVLIAIHLNRKQNRFNVNRIASIYGKNNIESYIEQQVKNGNYVDGDKKRSSLWGYELGLQLPSLVQSEQRSSEIIITSSKNNASPMKPQTGCQAVKPILPNIN